MIHYKGFDARCNGTACCLSDDAMLSALYSDNEVLEVLR